MTDRPTTADGRRWMTDRSTRLRRVEHENAMIPKYSRRSVRSMEMEMEYGV